MQKSSLSPFSHVDQSLLPQSQQTTKMGSKQVMIDTAEGQQ